MANQLTRKIMFYQIIWIKGDAEKSTAMGSLNDMNSILTNCAKLHKGDLYDFILEKHDGKFNNKSYWKISKIRKSDFPLKYKYSDSSNEALGLGDDEGLSEISHFVIFDGKFLAVEYNYHSIRSVSSTIAGLINGYIEKNNIKAVEHVEIRPILKREVYNSLNNMSEISKIELKIATDYAKILMGEYEDDTSIRDMLASARLAATGMNLHLVFGLQRGIKRKSRFEVDNLIGVVKRLIGRNDLMGNVRILKIKGLEKDEIKDINLLEELVITERRVAKIDDKTKAVDPNDMYWKITESYNLLKDNVLLDYIHPNQEDFHL